ncbi:U3 small nucleolar RNA-associated protein 15 [Grifola frondosa]|uniref:U3 small nucleolar RNA-associated protein 15 n=1 Tax=Grifola frondosa TaxID=5627 RepID=A0A1C7M1U6_GRIFR|nr:U3 small nucleolar RNA-associated protein 15 [Grifola frondosa]
MLARHPPNIARNLDTGDSSKTSFHQGIRPSHFCPFSLFEAAQIRCHGRHKSANIRSPTQKVTKTISRFKDVARSGCIRGDGKLVVAGDDTGLIQVFDINSRAILRTLDSHKQPVHVTKFSSLNQTQVLSCSDEYHRQIVDVPSQSAISTFTDHTDYVRSGKYPLLIPI